MVLECKKRYETEIVDWMVLKIHRVERCMGLPMADYAGISLTDCERIGELENRYNELVKNYNCDTIKCSCIL